MAALGTLLAIAAFRGLVDIFARRVIPWPNLFGAETALLQEDVVSRRRAWYWRGKYRLVGYVLLLFVIVWIFQVILYGQTAFSEIPGIVWGWMQKNLASVLTPTTAITIVILLFANVGILIGPFLLMAIRQIKAYEPGDANWGVKLEHVRGQAEAKEEITRVINLWQASDEFKKAGGKPERGLLFLGSPGTGKTMLAKAHRHRVQLAVRDRPGLGLRRHVHRHGHPRRAVPRLEGQEARAQVGRPVHRLHRRDRRGRHAPQLARRRRLLAARRLEQHPRPPVLRPERRADRLRRRDAEVVRAGASGCSPSAKAPRPRVARGHSSARSAGASAGPSTSPSRA